MTIVVVDSVSACLESGANVDAEVEGLVVERYEEWAGHLLHDALEHSLPLDDLGLDEPAWLHYTTGTTGQPKGVLSCRGRRCGPPSPVTSTHSA